MFPRAFHGIEKKIPPNYHQSENLRREKLLRPLGGVEIKKTDIAAERGRASFDGNRAHKRIIQPEFTFYMRVSTMLLKHVRLSNGRSALGYFCVRARLGFQGSIRIVIGSFPRRCTRIP